jgi:DNA excision repair protein ERCC-4
MKKSSEFKIIVDTREKRGYTFANIKPQPSIEIETLQTGDYSIKGMKSIVAVERKSMADAFQTFGKGRKRFERELARLSKMQYAAVVIEEDWMTILTKPPRYSMLKPRTIYVSVIAWQQRFGVHFWLCPGRDFAEKTTYRLLERFYRDKQTANNKKRVVKAKKDETTKTRKSKPVKRKSPRTIKRKA